MGTAESRKKWHNVAKDTMYNFAPALDRDIITSKKNLEDAQVKLAHKWVIEDLMLDSQMGSDPICSSAGCPVNKHREEANRNIIQYPDPLE